MKNIANHFPIDDVLSLKILEFDKENKKIVLSAIAALKEKSEDEIKAYLDKHKLERVTVQEIMNVDTGSIDTSDFPIFEVPDDSLSGSSEKK